MFAPKVAKPQTKADASPTRNVEPQRSAPPAQRVSRLTGAKPGGDQEREANSEITAAREATHGVAWDISGIALFPPERAGRLQPSHALNATPLPAAIQAKLVVGSVDDPLEHEADRVADQVMRMPEPDLPIGASPPQMSRKCAAYEGEDKAKRLQMKPALANAAAGEVPAAVHEALRSAGQALELGNTRLLRAAIWPQLCRRPNSRQFACLSLGRGARRTRLCGRSGHRVWRGGIPAGQQGRRSPACARARACGAAIQKNECPKCRAARGRCGRSRSD